VIILTLCKRHIDEVEQNVKPDTALLRLKFARRAVRIVVFVLRSLNFARGAVRIVISLFRSFDFVSGAVRITIHFSCDMH
jgi:hypothetical protein